MQRDLKGLWRCMGGRFCNHTPGTCTATVGRHAPEPKNQHMSDELVEAVRAAINAVEYAGANVIIDATQDDAREAADAAIRTLAPMMAEVMAKVADKRADDRFAEHGVTEYDTNASYYSGSRAEAYDELDEEDWAISRDIRAKGKEMADG